MVVDSDPAPAEEVAEAEAAPGRTPPPGGGSGRLSFFIDGAHTPESMVTCAEWFAATAQAQPVLPGEFYFWF